MSTLLVAADVGASKTDLALYSAQSGPDKPLASATVITAKYPSFSGLVSEFIEGAGHTVDRAVFAVAGPVVNGGVTATISHLPWALDQRLLQRDLNIESLELINDLEAAALAVPHLGTDDLELLKSGRTEKHGARAIIAPGTGLGEAFLLWDGKEYRACTSEGGHANLASSNPFEVELCQYIQKTHGYASYELACSGLGLPNIYACLKTGNYAAEPAWLATQLAAVEDPTPIIIQAVIERNPPAELCDLTAQIFIDILAAEAGNLALKVVATGGVYLGGGLGLRLLPFLQREQARFCEAFCNKGIMAEMMKDIPVQVIVHPQVVLVGATRHAMHSADH